MNTELYYAGKIKLYINIGNKTIEVNAKNAGTSTLHESICRFLAGQYRGNYDIPQYLDIRSVDDVSVLVNVIPLSGRTLVIDDDNVYTRCDCSILYSSLKIFSISFIFSITSASKSPSQTSATFPVGTINSI